MRTDGRLLVACGLLLACGCAKPFTAPAKQPASVAVLPPSNRTGDDLLVAGGSFLDQYVFKTERVTVPEILLAETRTFLEKRGYDVVSGEKVEAATHGVAPATVEQASRLATQAGLGDVLYLAIRRWDSLDQSTPAAVVVSIEASLIDSSGHVVWQANRPAKPVQTKGSINQGTAYAIAVKAVVEELFDSWHAGAR